MSQLTQLPNIGKILACQLEAVGIHSPEELAQVGSKEAWLRILQQDDSACYNRLCALEGAIQEIRWHDLPAKIKADLKDFYNQQKHPEKTAE